MANDKLSRLAATFTYSEARFAGLSDRLIYQLRDDGTLEEIGRGLYRKASAPLVDIDLLEIARRANAPTLCLTSALARHGLTDQIPATIDIALPRDSHRPVVTAPVTWHSFDRASFGLGRQQIHLDDNVYIGLYDAERSIVDAMRLGHREGRELAIEALKQWLRRRSSSPADLLAIAAHFPGTHKELKRAMEILL